MKIIFPDFNFLININYFYKKNCCAKFILFNTVKKYLRIRNYFPGNNFIGKRVLYDEILLKDHSLYD